MIRTAIASVLLFAISFQMVVSLVAFKKLNVEVVKSQMSVKEILASQIFKSKTGVDTHLQEISERHLNAIGYSNLFVISEDMNGEQVSFFIANDEYALSTTEENYFDIPDHLTSPEAIAVLKITLPEYTAPKSNSATIRLADSTTKSIQYLSNCILEGHYNITSPPPQGA